LSRLLDALNRYFFWQQQDFDAPYAFIYPHHYRLSWKQELTGGILFTAIGVIMTLLHNLNHNRNQFSVAESINVVLMICFPFIVVGALFIISYFKSRKAV
jgi:uncharacterized membrane protein YesL